MGSFVLAHILSGSFGFAWVHSCATIGRRVHLNSCGFGQALLEIVGFILVRVWSLRRDKESPD